MIIIGKLNEADIGFLEFRPSEVAAAVAISVSMEVQAVDIDKYLGCLIHVDKVINNKICYCQRRTLALAREVIGAFVDPFAYLL